MACVRTTEDWRGWMEDGADVYCIITCKYSTAISFQKEARLMRGNESFLSSSLV